MSKKQVGMDLDSIRSSSGSDKKVTMQERVMMLKMPEKKWVTLRLYGAAFSYAGYWVNTKKKDGTKTMFYTDCPSYDPATQMRDSTIYDPWREIEAAEQDLEQPMKTVKFTRSVLFNGIFRSAQKQEPSKKARQTKTETSSGFKEKDSDSWTPVYAIKFTASVAAKIKEQSGLNVVEIKGQTKAFPVTHPKYGCDVRIMYDKSKAPADQYQISIGERSPLTEEESLYLLQDLSDLVDDVPEAEVKRDFESWANRSGYKLPKAKKMSNEDFDDSDDEEDEEDEAPKSKSKKPVAKPSKKKVVEEDDEEESDFDDEEDDEPAPVSKKKPAAKGKAKPVVEESEDEDEDDSDFDDEDDEDDEPVAKKKPVAKGKAKPVEDDEDDSDFDDDEDDEPAPKAKPAAKGKKAVVEESDDSDFDDDEDDEPVSKKKVIAKSSKKAVVEESDDEDEDDMDDEEEVKPVAKKKVASKPVVKSKKKPVVEDDDDDFDD